MNNDTLRYSRQLILDGFGIDGQKKCKDAKVLVIGAGGLGSPVLYYLAAAGVGTVGIADFDTVTLSNLNRQVIHFTEDIGNKKTDSAETKIKALNPNTKVIKYDFRLNADNIEAVVRDFDVVIDATDNFSTRYLISDCCYFMGKPLVEGAATGYLGILMTIIPGKTPCYRCLYPDPPEDGTIETCSDVGILGMVTGMIGSLEALEAVKVITGIGETVSGRVIMFDALSTEFIDFELLKKSECALCGEQPTITELVEYQINCKVKEGF
ncbi:MAG: HesA/MoeB/ThiF family protein [Peptostreptococcaceae bacterium]|nr:HesA/MoeB/ThiF family protein [Peptostreptococcaceae bacterium]